MGYFNLKETIKKYNIDWKNRNVCLAMNGDRNIGKTTDIINTMFDDPEFGVNNNKKIAFIRNQKNQLDMFKADFNARMKGRYVCKGNMIYSLKTNTIFNKEGEEITTFHQDEHVGYIGAITTYLTMKSIQSENIRYIIFDEYNEESDVKDVYKHFLSLFKTLERFNRIFFLMCGNRETPNNEFMVKWEILPPKERIEEDILTKICDNDKLQHYFLELGFNQFRDLNNQDTLSYHFSQFDADTLNYMNGGYANEIHYRVLPFNKCIKDTFNACWGFILDETLICLGEFQFQGKIKYACCINEYARELLDKEDLVIYSLDIAAYQDSKSKILAMQDANKIVERLLLEHKKKNLFFDSYDVLESIKKRMIFSTIFSKI